MKNKRTPVQPSSVRILVLCDRNATVARVTLAQYDEATGAFLVEEATGSAKRERFDRRDDKIASDLAVGRALAKLGRQLQRNGREQVALAATQQRDADRARIERRLKDRVKPPVQQRQLSIGEILETYGPQAAERAAFRRGEDAWPHGKHERTDQVTSGDGSTGDDRGRKE